MRENRCLLIEGQLPCLGPVTRGGCLARCPSYGVVCEGCRGAVPGANATELIQLLHQAGLTAEEILGRLERFRGRSDGGFSIEPLTRVEGHGRVDLHVLNGRLQRVQLALLDAPRLFEGLVRGRPFHELPALVCCICSICSAVHRIAAASAIKNALQVSIPPVATKIRELLLLGGDIESHALHLFCLIYPDLRGVDHFMTLLARGMSPSRRDLN